MNIGRLDKRIEIQKRSVSTDEWNHSVITYATEQTVWAPVNFRAGRETQTAEQRVNVDRVFFTIRQYSGINVMDRVKYAGNYYDIESIETIGRGRGHRLITTKRDNDE